MRKKSPSCVMHKILKVRPSFFEALYFYSIQIELICILLFPFNLNLFQQNSPKIFVKPQTPIYLRSKIDENDNFELAYITVLLAV